MEIPDEEERERRQQQRPAPQPRPLSQATLLLLRPGPEAQAIRLNGQAVPSTPRNLHGFEFDALTLDLAGQTKVQVG